MDRFEAIRKIILRTTQMKKNILIVDDEENMLNSLSITLKMAGYGTETAKDGQEAFNKIMAAKEKGKLIDLIITGGIIMPNLDGLNLITKLHRHNAWIPVIVINRHSDKNTVFKLLRKRCDAYINKPFEPADIVQCVSNFFDKHIRK